MDVEIVIADGLSDDGTREILARFERNDPRLRVIENHAKIASTGLNAAILAAKGEVILRMDAHTEYAPDYIRNCVQILQETGADNVGGPALTRANGFMAQAIASAFHSPFTHGGSKFHDARFEGFVDTVPYGCWKKSTLERIGLFDESLIRNQDDELNFRIISARRPDLAVVRNCFLGTGPGCGCVICFSSAYFQYGFWKRLLSYANTAGPLHWRHLVPATTVACGLLLVFGSIGGLFGRGEQVESSSIHNLRVAGRLCT